MATGLVALLVAIFLALNAWASLVAIRSPRYENYQKRLQVLLIWLVPVVGAILVWSLANDVLSKKITTDLGDRSGFDDGTIRLEDSSGDFGAGDSSGDAGGGGD